MQGATGRRRHILHYKTRDSHLKMKQKGGPKRILALTWHKTNAKNQKYTYTSAKWIRDDAWERREERAHFALENSGFAFKNEAK